MAGVWSSVTTVESNRRILPKDSESASAVRYVTYRPRFYKIFMVRMYALAGILTNLRMYGSRRRPYRNVWVCL